VTPSVLSFGLISPPDFRDLGFTIRNNGVNASDVCQIYALDIGAGSHTFFSLPNGPIDQKELQPNESMQVLARVSLFFWSYASGDALISVGFQFNAKGPFRLSALIGTRMAEMLLTSLPGPYRWRAYAATCQGMASRSATFRWPIISFMWRGRSAISSSRSLTRASRDGAPVGS
jgi:hypothetical protein